MEMVHTSEATSKYDDKISQRLLTTWSMLSRNELSRVKNRLESCISLGDRSTRVYVCVYTSLWGFTDFGLNDFYLKEKKKEKKIVLTRSYSFFQRSKI